MHVQPNLGLLSVDELTRPMALRARQEFSTQNLQRLPSDDVANSRLDGAYQTVEDYFRPIALEAADQAPYELARAVLGELVVRDLLAQNATTELVNIENMIIDAIKGEPQSGFVRPEITFAPNGVISPNQTAWMKLPKNVDGAFVAGQSSEPGTILLSDRLKGPDSQESQRVVLEELGEALGAHFEDKGFSIAAGDIGHRLMKVFLGKPLKAEDFMRNSSGADAQLIDFKGTKTMAKTATDEVLEELPTVMAVDTLGSGPINRLDVELLS